MSKASRLFAKSETISILKLLSTGINYNRIGFEWIVQSSIVFC